MVIGHAGDIEPDAFGDEVCVPAGSRHQNVTRYFRFQVSIQARFSTATTLHFPLLTPSPL
jgi:hypothetical protein